MKIVGFFALAFFIPAFALAAELVNINTADATLLDTLPGIGPTYAARIIDYRAAHGPFAHTEDIQNVIGIGPSTYTDIAPLITVGVAQTPATPAQATSTPNTSAIEDTATSATAPATLSVRVSGDTDALLGVPLHLRVRVTTKGVSTQVSWSFGDGSAATGIVADKVYRYAGTYLVVVTATDGETVARDILTVTVKPAVVSVAVAVGEGIVLMNDSQERLDLSGWRLIVDTSSFHIPEGMTLLPEASALLPYAITRLPMSSEVTLAYPDGAVAAHTAPHTSGAIEEEAAQPSASVASLSGVQTVESVSTSISGTAYENTAVRAPAAATELAAAGAALSLLPEADPPPAGGLFRSPWTLSFIGLMALAGSAFIFL